MGDRHSMPGSTTVIRQLEDWHFWFVSRDRLVRALLSRHQSMEPILDVGCGTGRFARGIEEQGNRVIAIDMHAPSEAVSNAVRASATELPLRSGSVGTVMARDVMEHVDDVRLLDEAHRVLVDGGLLIILVPAWPSMWSGRDENAGHLRRYTRRGLVRLVASRRFTIVEVRGYQFLLLPLMMISRVAERITGRSASDREQAPGSLGNRLLGAVNAWEVSWARRAWPRPPHGTSLVIVARPHD